ncbi:hypothetical protein PENTCL1PPCAC_3724, partial [Pristionchus entomophagus]
VLNSILSVAGLILNLVLMYAIRRFSKSHFGTYKYLLTIFTLNDLFLVLLHVMVHPVNWSIEKEHSTLWAIVKSFQRVTALYVGFQSVPFSLLAIHFLYRYWSVCRPHRIELFSNKIFVLFLASLIAGGVISWYFLCLFCSEGHDVTIAKEILVSEYEIKYEKRVENAWVILDNWRDGKFDLTLFVVTLLMDAITILSLIFTFSFAILTFYHIAKSDKMSIQATALQQKLLIALCAQASVPFVFVYAPFLVCINLPFLGIPGNTFYPDLVAPIFTCFPVWDGFIIIVLIQDYRKGLLGMIRKPPPVAPSTML